MPHPYRFAGALARRAPLSVLLTVVLSCARAADSTADSYDVLIRGGSVYDGSGGAPVIADVAIRGDSIAAIGPALRATARDTVDATGMAVSPGFINMLSWATESLIEDGRSENVVTKTVPHCVTT